MLQNSFYTVTRRESIEQGVKGQIVLNAAHAIFEGHFPGQPVVPGVCMMQIVRELTQDSTGIKLKIAEADNIKFLTVIDPRMNPDIEVDIKHVSIGNGFSVTGTLFAGTTIFFKFKGMLLPA